MSVINNKGFVNGGVTHLQLVEKFPTSIAREGFSSLTYVTQKNITRIGTSDTFLINYTLVHTMTYRPVTESTLKTTTKTYTINIPLRLTDPPAEGTLPDINTVTSLGNQTFVSTCGRCPDGVFNKYIRDIALEFEVQQATPVSEN